MAALSHRCMTLIEEIQARRLPPAQTRRAIRLAAGVSQVRMAAELGVHRLTFVRWENGTHQPKGDAGERYARLLSELAKVVAA
jgi:DNA-binding transcriptional regulator YiaG